jgi:hypothetical protein
VRVLGRFGLNGVLIPALDFASTREILDQDAGGVNVQIKYSYNVPDEKLRAFVWHKFLSFL